MQAGCCRFESDWLHLDTTYICSVQCGARCCQSPAIYLTESEHERLFPDYTLAPELETTTYHAVAETGGFLILQHPCPHLGDDNLCQVYDQRPASCRDFPYSLTPNCPLSELIYG